MKLSFATFNVITLSCEIKSLANSIKQEPQSLNRVLFSHYLSLYHFAFRMKNLEPVPKLRTRKSSQENGSGLSNRGRMSGGVRGQAGEQRPTEMRTSSSISNLTSGASPRPRSTSLTRSQSQRLGGGRGRGQGPGSVTSRSPAVGLVRPRSSTVASSTHRGQHVLFCITKALFVEERIYLISHGKNEIYGQV